MRNYFFLALFAVAGCGDSGGLVVAKADLVMPLDFAMPPPDFAMPLPDFAKPLPDLSVRPVADAAGIQCGNAVCGVGMLCCVTVTDAGMASQSCAKSCPDGGIPLSCDGPEDCPDPAKKICCANLDVGAGNPPNCPINAARTNCAAACKTNIQLQCPGMNTVRFCHQAVDCAGDPQYNKCCEFQQNGAMVTFCVDALISNFAKQCF